MTIKNTTVLLQDGEASEHADLDTLSAIGDSRYHWLPFTNENQCAGPGRPYSDPKLVAERDASTTDV